MDEPPNTNPRLDWMDKQVTLTLNGGELAILTGLTSREWTSLHGDQKRVAYVETIRRLRQKLITASDRL